MMLSPSCAASTAARSERKLRRRRPIAHPTTSATMAASSACHMERKQGIVLCHDSCRYGCSCTQTARLTRSMDHAVLAQAGPATMACEAAWLARSASLASSSSMGAASASGPACSPSSAGSAGASRPSHASGPASRTCAPKAHVRASAWLGSHGAPLANQGAPAPRMTREPLLLLLAALLHTPGDVCCRCKPPSPGSRAALLTYSFAGMSALLLHARPHPCQASMQYCKPRGHLQGAPIEAGIAACLRRRERQAVQQCHELSTRARSAHLLPAARGAHCSTPLAEPRSRLHEHGPVLPLSLQAWWKASQVQDMSR